MEASEGPKTLPDSSSPPPAAANPPDGSVQAASQKRRRRTLGSRVPIPDTMTEYSRRRRRTRASLSPQEASFSGPPEFDQDGEVKNEQFRAGDFVWGKLADCIWWPGKVLNPSEQFPAANMHGESRHVFVVFFGDGSGSWHDPSQLKPFKEMFKQMVKQSSSKRFVAAVTEALIELKKVLESELGKILSASVSGDGVADRSVGKHVLDASKFLELLLVAARDVSNLDKLEVTMLSCWLMAFHRQNKHPADIEEKEAIDSSVDKLEEARYVAGDESRMLKRANLLDDSNQKRKERSIAELIADKDSEIKDQNDKGDDAVVLDVLDPSALKSRKRKKSDKSEISDAENRVCVSFEEKATGLGNEDSSAAALTKQKEDEKSKCSDLNKGEDEVNEQSGYSRRERKKSKYLSPPYTSVSGHKQHIVLSKDESLEISEKCDAFKASLDGTPPNLEGDESTHQNQEENESMPLFKYKEISTAEILSKLLLAAADPLYLKWSGSAKMVRNFINMFRGFVYSDGPNFLSYKDKLDHLGSGCTLFKEDLSVRYEKRKDLEKMIRSNGGTRDETSVSAGHNLTGQNGSSESSKRRKIRKENAAAGTSLQIDHNNANFAKKIISRHKREMRKSVDDKSAQVDRPHELTNTFERDKLLINKGKNAANGLTQDDPGDPNSCKLEKRKSDNKSNGETILKSCQKHSAGSGELDSGKKNSPRILDSPVYLILTYAEGANLPSKEEIISIHSAYGALVESDIQVFEDSNIVHVVFKSLPNAEMAVKLLYADQSLPPTIAKYELHKPENRRYKSQRTPGSGTPLPYIRKNLEKMIRKLSEFTPNAIDERISNHLMPDVRDILVGDMNSLLHKVDKILTGSSAGNRI